MYWRCLYLYTINCNLFENEITSQFGVSGCGVMRVITEALCNGNYIALISASARIHCALVVRNSERVTVVLHSTFLKFHWSGVLSVLSGCYTAGAKWNCCHVLNTPQPHTSLQCHLIWSHIHRMHVCLAVTCHLHLWQNDRDVSWASVGTLTWNRYWK